MYKLTMLFFFLTVYSGQSLTDTYQIIFDNENASYTLKIDNGGLLFENNQPDVTVKEHGESTSTTENNIGKIYKITKGATWQEGLKIGGEDQIDILKIGGEDIIDVLKIGEEDQIDILKIGEEDDIDILKIGGEDVIDLLRETNALLFGIEDHQAYEIMLSYKMITIVEKSSNEKTTFSIEDGVYLNISSGKFVMFR